jgi:dTDP-4-amino-4,6-dideoxygalactose transaminase
VYHQFVIRTHSRDELKTFLAEQRIETLIHYPTPPFLQPAYQDLGLKKQDFPIATLIAATALSLPLWPGMTTDQVDYVSEQIVKFYR